MGDINDKYIFMCNFDNNFDVIHIYILLQFTFKFNHLTSLNALSKIIQLTILFTCAENATANCIANPGQIHNYNIGEVSRLL